MNRADPHRSSAIADVDGEIAYVLLGKKLGLGLGHVLQGKGLREKRSDLVTLNVSDAVPLLPADEVKSPVVLIWEPGTEEVTSIWIVQLAPAATLPPA